MEQIIAKLLQDFEQGKMNRRQLIQSLALTATAASEASAAAAAADNKGFKALYVNHISYQVADYAKTRDFYADLLGMKISEDDGKQCRLTFGDNILLPRTRPSGTPKVDHIAYTIANWDKEKERVQDELNRRGLKVQGEITDSTVHVLDPDGFPVQFGGLRQ
jgi:catechol 2,3-dioxygenase-like lactoylglutathione lyase family enzyme